MDAQDKLMSQITDAMAENRMGHLSQSEMESGIAKLQGTMKTRHYTHPMWKVASLELAWFFRDMQRRQNSGSLEA